MITKRRGEDVGDSLRGVKRVRAAGSQSLQSPATTEPPPNRTSHQAAGGPPAERRRTSVPRSLNPRQRLGALLLIAVIATVIVASRWPPDGPDPTPIPDPIVVTGYGGPLKLNFVDDPEVAKILEERYGLEVELKPVGSIEMLQLVCGGLPEETDFLWAGDQSTLNIFVQNGGKMVASDNIYSSPLVIYSWTPIVDELVNAGIAHAQPGDVYTIDLPLLFEKTMQHTTWAQLGLPQLHGEVLVHTSDPTRSNSGLLFAALLTTILNGGNVPNSTTVGPLLPAVADYFDRLGFMVASTNDLFEQFVTTGMGARPMIVAYESQLMEYLHEHPALRDQVLRDIRILYPQPTVWATHPLIALTDDGARLLDALKDPEIQRLAWERHGQRPGVPGVPINPTATGVPGILMNPAAVNMPGQDVLSQILMALGAPPPCGATPVPTPLATTQATTPIARGRTRARPQRALRPASSLHERHSKHTPLPRPPKRTPS